MSQIDMDNAMARPGIDVNDVVKAITEILAAGDNPSDRKILQHLGTGSLQTVAKYRKTANQELGRQALAGYPEGIPEQLHGSIKALWECARDAAHDGYASQRELLSKERERYERQVTEAADAMREQEAVARQFRAETESLSEQVADLRARLTRADARSETLSAELSDSRDRIENLITEHSRHVEGLNESFRSEKLILESRIAELVSSLDAANKSLDKNEGFFLQRIDESRESLRVLKEAQAQYRSDVEQQQRIDRERIVALDRLNDQLNSKLLALQDELANERRLNAKLHKRSKD